MIVICACVQYDACIFIVNRVMAFYFTYTRSKYVILWQFNSSITRSKELHFGGSSPHIVRIPMEIQNLMTLQSVHEHKYTAFPS